MADPTTILKRVLWAFFDLGQEEMPKTLRLQATIFLLLTSLLIVKPTVTSIFLAELTSDALPLGYLLTALFAIVGSVFYSKMSDRYSLRDIFQKTIWFSVFLWVLFGVLLKLDLARGVIFYAMYVWVAIFGLLTASQFWTLANLSYNVREAKRVFGFIGAGAIAGAIFGGYLTTLLANFFSTENFLFLASALMLLTLPLVHKVWVEDIDPLNKFQKSNRSGGITDSSVQLIRKSPLLMRISIVVGIGVIVAKLVDYQYSDYASRLITDQDELTAFFGFWLSTLSVVSLLIQLFLTKRVVGTWGVGTSLLWLPTGILAASILLLIHPVLWVIVFLKLIDGSLKQSINKSATELLAIPVPLDIKKKTKPFIDVVIDSIATGAAGMLLIFFINGMNIPAKGVSLIVIVLIALWLYFIKQVRDEYINSFKSLIENSDRQPSNWVQEPVAIESIMQSIFRVLKTGSEAQIAFMLKKVLESPHEKFRVAIEPLLDHPSLLVRHLTIENLLYLKPSEKILDHVLKSIDSGEYSVTTSAFKYLIKCSGVDLQQKNNQFLNHRDPVIRNSWLVAVAQEFRNNEAGKIKLRLAQSIAKCRHYSSAASTDDQVINEKSAILKAIGHGRVQLHYDYLWEHLESNQTELAKTTLSCCALTLDPQFIPAIVRRLSSKSLRESVMKALHHYGEPVIHTLTDYIKQGSLDLEQAKFIPMVLEKFSNQAAVKALLFIARNTEHVVRMEALSALKRIRKLNPQLKINDRALIESILDECFLYQQTLSALYSQISARERGSTDENAEEYLARNALIKLLESRLERPLARIFAFLGLKYPPDDIDPIYHTLKKGQEEEQIHALEFLDNILHPRLKRELIPIVETTIVESSYLDLIKQWKLEMISEQQCFSALLKRPDTKLKLSVINLIRIKKDLKYLELLSGAAADSNVKVKQSAQQAIRTIEEVTSE